MNSFLLPTCLCFLIVVYCQGIRLRSATMPSKVIGAYASWSECDDKIVRASKQGANVILWFSINLLTDETTGLPTISGGPDYDCVARMTKAIADLNLPTVHMISVGGWDSPHPDTTNSPREVYNAWKHWNENVIAKPELGFYGFDGIDWDIEGNDDFESPYNYFTVDCLDLMGKFSQYAKQDGYLVSMAPAESYLDPTTELFDRFVNHTYPEWNLPDFKYHGHNVYGYILVKYGETLVIDVKDRIEKKVSTFDMISMQLYEGYSHCDYNTTQLNQSFASYLVNLIEKANKGWLVRFSSDDDSSLSDSQVAVPTTQLVIGLANAWAATSDGKFLYVTTSEIRRAYEALELKGIAPKGFMYWDIADDGIEVDGLPVYMSKELNSIMKIR